MNILRTVLCTELAWILLSMSGPAHALNLIIEGVTLIDGTGRPPVAEVSVLVLDGRIEAISPGALPAPSHVQRIDGRGKYLIPGLMDMHVHVPGRATLAFGNFIKSDDAAYGIRSLHSYLYFGVTSIYDAGNVPDYIFGLRSQERVGEIESPRIFTTGAMVTYPGSHGSSNWATLVTGWPDAIPALEEHIGRQPDMLKLTYEERGWAMQPMVPKLPLPLMGEIIRYYNDRGIRTTVHATSEYRAREAIMAGVDTLAHPIIQGPITEEFARMMAAKAVPMVTTLTIAEMYHRLTDSPEYLEESAYQATLTAEEIDTLRTATRDAYQARAATDWWRVMAQVGKDNLRRIHAAGGVLVAGTDRTTGPDLHRELDLLVEAGIPPIDVLRIATLHGAIFLGREQELGSIEVGKFADMVLLAADPTRDISNTRHIVQVIKGGRVIDRAKLNLPINDRD